MIKTMIDPPKYILYKSTTAFWYHQVLYLRNRLCGEQSVFQICHILRVPVQTFGLIVEFAQIA